MNTRMPKQKEMRRFRQRATTARYLDSTNARGEGGYAQQHTTHLDTPRMWVPSCELEKTFRSFFISEAVGRVGRAGGVAIRKLLAANPILWSDG